MANNYIWTIINGKLAYKKRANGKLYDAKTNKPIKVVQNAGQQKNNKESANV